MGYDMFLKNYFDTLINHIKQAQESYTVVDYFHKHKGIDLKYNKRKYKHRDKEYYGIIEDKLASGNLQYSRISQLPYRYDKVVIDEKDERGKVSFENSVYEFVKLLFSGTFKHICRCFQKYPDKFNLYLLHKPLRLFNLYIIDDKFVISEYDRYNYGGLPVPDMLFVNGTEQASNNDRVKRLISHHKNNLKLLGIDIDCKGEECLLGKHRVTKELFIAKTVCLYKMIEKKIESLKSQINKQEEKCKNDKATSSTIEQNLTKLSEMREQLVKLKEKEKSAKKKYTYMQGLFFEDATEQS